MTTNSNLIKQSFLENTNTTKGKEITIQKESVFNFKFNVDKTIDYTNYQYTQTSGYEAYELINEPLDMLFHPDMPKLIFSILKEYLDKGQEIQIIQKYLAADGRFFWLSSIYSSKVDSQGGILNYLCTSVPVSLFATEKISALYTILTKIETKSGVEAAKRYLLGFFENENTTYNSFVNKLSTISVNNDLKQGALVLDSNENNIKQQAHFTKEQYSIFTRKTSKPIPRKKEINYKKGA